MSDGDEHNARTEGMQFPCLSMFLRNCLEKRLSLCRSSRISGPGFDDCEEDLAGLEDDEGCGALARMEASVGPTAIHDQNERLSLREKVGSHLVGIVGSNVLDWLLDLS
jgi:hypothetical protein